MKKIFLIFTGWVFVGLGILGAFLPLLPTTPFLLVSAACFLKSSPRFYSWLMNNKFLGSYIENYTNKKGITLKAKIITLVLLNSSIAYSVYLFWHNIYISIGLAIVAVSVSIHLIIMKTLVESD